VQLRDAGSALTLGSDSHAVIDLFEEMRAVELNERLATQERGHWSAPELLKAATGDGHRSIGFEDAGVIEVGARADLVAIRLDTVRTAGTVGVGGAPVGGSVRSTGAIGALAAARAGGAVRSTGTVGGGLESAVFAASAADVSDVIVAGKHLVADGKHIRMDVAAELASSITAVTR
jgi:cytosine/adenosine deaminase-related metal-dependent hydrolase